MEGPEDYKTADELIGILVNNVAFGGVLTLNVGPAADGTIIPIQQERLLEMGEWLSVNGDGIYYTRPWRVQAENTTVNTFYTQKNSTVYAIFTSWPTAGTTITLLAPITTAQTTVNMLTGSGAGMSLQFTPSAGAKPGLTVQLPTYNPETIPCQYAWTLRLENVG